MEEIENRMNNMTDRRLESKTQMKYPYWMVNVCALI